MRRSRTVRGEEGPPGIAPRGDFLFFLVLAVFASFLFLYRLGDRSLWGSEGRWAEIAREMLASSDWVTPRINGTPYRDKPVLSYQLIAALAPLTGGRVTELTARLPSALAAICSVLLLYGLAGRLYDRNTARVASLILAGSFYLVFWGRTASADVMTMTGVLLSLWIFVRFEASRRRIWIYPFALSMALNSLTKGLLGFVLPLIVLIPYVASERRWETIVNRHTLPAGLLALLVYLTPFLLDSERSGSASSLYLVFKENILRFFTPFDHKEPFYYYFYEIFVIFVPWALFLPGALFHEFRKGFPMEKGRRFALLYFCALFLFFTLSGSRRSYYLIPLFPAGSLIVGRMWSDLIQHPPRTRGERLQMVVPTFLLFLLFSLVSVLLLSRPPFLRPYSSLSLTRHGLVAAFFSAGLVAALLFFLKNRIRVFVALFLVVIASADLYYIAGITPEMESLRDLKSFCGKVNRLHIPGGRLAVLHQWRQGNLYFYLDRIPIRRFERPDSARRYLRDPKNRLLIEAKDIEQVGGLDSVVVLMQQAPSGGKRKDLKRFLLIAGHETSGTSIRKGSQQGGWVVLSPLPQGAA